MTAVVDSHEILIAGGAFALPRLIRTALLPRVLGLYLATCAGAIQLLDITVDRFALDDRFFTFAIILAVLGIPCAGAGAILAEAARTERRPQRAAPTAGTGDSSEPLSTGTRADRGHDTDALDMAANAQPLSDLPRRLELALSFRRIAELHGRNGEEAEAAGFRLRSRRELENLKEEIARLVDTS